jgi:Thioesterase superfamily
MAADLDALTALMPFAADMGMRLEEASADRVVAALPWTAWLCTAGGIMHGGAIMSLADTAGALVAYLGCPRARRRRRSRPQRRCSAPSPLARCAPSLSRCTAVGQR